jgi:predicted metal-dependent peptidase
MKKTMNDLLSRAIIRLYDEERFYAELLLQMDRIISKNIPTAGVCIKSRIQLYVNLEFFESLSKPEQVAVLKHECQHILNDHIPRAKELDPTIYEKKKKDDIDGLINTMKHQVINIAADCSINPGIPNRPKDCMMPKMFGLHDGDTFEWYVENLKNNEKLKDLTHFDGHPLWAESEGEKEELKEKIKQAVNEAAQKTRAAGKMTANDELLVDRINYKARDWKSDLKRFAARAMETAITQSKKKRNRRYGIMYPGSVKEELLHIGVALDTSGSVSDEAICQFMAEVGNIAKYATVTVVEADTEVKNAYLFDPKKTYKVKGRGGTAYQPAFDYFTKNTEVDGVIYFGDMDCLDEKLIKPKYPVMWAIVGEQNPLAEWGSKTKIEVTRK